MCSRLTDRLVSSDRFSCVCLCVSHHSVTKERSLHGRLQVMVCAMDLRHQILTLHHRRFAVSDNGHQLDVLPVLHHDTVSEFAWLLSKVVPLVLLSVRRYRHQLPVVVDEVVRHRHVRTSRLIYPSAVYRDDVESSKKCSQHRLQLPPNHPQLHHEGSLRFSVVVAILTDDI